MMANRKARAAIASNALSKPAAIPALVRWEPGCSTDWSGPGYGPALILGSAPDERSFRRLPRCAIRDATGSVPNASRGLPLVSPTPPHYGGQKPDKTKVSIEQDRQARPPPTQGL